MNEERALHRLGIRLLDGESVQTVFDEKEGLTENLGGLGKRKGFLLTDHRIIYVEGKNKVRSALLGDIGYLGVEHKERDISKLISGIVSILIGAPIVVGPFFVPVLSDTIFAPVFVLLGMLVVVCGFGLVAEYRGSGQTSLMTTIGGKDCPVILTRKLTDEAEEFSTRFFEYKRSC